MESNNSSSLTSTRQLADIVVTAAKSSRKINKQATNIAKLRVSNMKLHGRDDDIKLLRGKLRELIKKTDDDDEKGDAAQAQNNEQRDDNEDDSTSNNNNLILVSGTSGTGKSALIRKGLGDPAAKNGYAFASGKFDEKSLRPLSAFSDAMTSLAKHTMVESNEKGGLESSGGLSTATLIRDAIQEEFDEADVEQLRRVLPGCTKLLGLVAVSHKQKSSMTAAFSKSSSKSKLGSLSVPAGKESIAQMQYAIRRFLKIICSNLKGVILFIDDLQWSDTATLDLLQSIVLDGDISSLMVVGAYREDEVPE